MSHKKTLHNDKLIIANCSGFYGDRFSAAKEMIQGGPIDFLTGDYLAELTMAILYRKVMKDPDGGYAVSFFHQMSEIMGECLEKKIRVVSNAGGLNPRALAEKLEGIAAKLGLKPNIAYIEGDNLIGRLEDLQADGEPFNHLDKGISLAEGKAQPISANAYLGGWGIARALEEGADIVITGRVTDAAVVVGPSAWKFNWKPDDWDRLAGAVTAGHIIECGGQATGGNYSFIDEVPSYSNLGFPIAEMHEDGSCVITKHPGTGGLVSVGTVTAQLLYETRQPTYLNPDVSTRFETIDISQQGPDRVAIKSVKGNPPPPSTKVCINTMGPYRITTALALCGLDMEKKAKIMEDLLFELVGGKEQFEQVDVQLIRTDKEDPVSNEEAVATLKITVMDSDPKKVGRAFSAKVVELALTSVPGLHGSGSIAADGMTIIHWPSLISNSKVQQQVFVGEEMIQVDPTPGEAAEAVYKVNVTIPDPPGGETVKVPLGKVFAARSGDKGGNANVGIWGKTPESYAFLRDFLTISKLKELLPDMASYEIERYELPNLLALNFYINGVLGEGVACSARNDPQAKSMGEYLRAKLVEMPASILV
jgi:acyclic terpene utilization AtuA family protein